MILDDRLRIALRHAADVAMRQATRGENQDACGGVRLGSASVQAASLRSSVVRPPRSLVPHRRAIRIDERCWRLQCLQPRLLLVGLRLLLLLHPLVHNLRSSAQESVVQTGEI